MIASPKLKRSFSPLSLSDPLANPLAQPTTSLDPTEAVSPNVGTSSLSNLSTQFESHPQQHHNEEVVLPVSPASHSNPITVSISPQLPLTKSYLTQSQIQMKIPSIATSPFLIRVSDPTKIPDGIKPYILYKVTCNVRCSYLAIFPYVSVCVCVFIALNDVTGL
jgi:hypothetical protein